MKIGLFGFAGGGKTTVFNLLSGVLKPTGGHIHFNNRDITRLRSDQSTALGIARTFQNIELFNEMTVLENILIGSQIKSCALCNWARKISRSTPRHPGCVPLARHARLAALERRHCR